MHRLVPFAALILIATPALAEGETVTSLLAGGFSVLGVMPSNAGPGILLGKGAELWMCFVAETPDSAEVTTQYCKPVR